MHSPEIKAQGNLLVLDQVWGGLKAYQGYYSSNCECRSRCQENGHARWGCLLRRPVNGEN